MEEDLKETPTNMGTRDDELPEWEGMRPESKTMTGNSDDPFLVTVQWKRITYISSHLNG
jgi:hypothetical protein